MIVIVYMLRMPYCPLRNLDIRIRLLITSLV